MHIVLSLILMLLCSALPAAAQTVSPLVPNNEAAPQHPDPVSQRLVPAPMLQDALTAQAPRRTAASNAIFFDSFEESGTWTVTDAAGLMRTGAQILNVRALDGERYMTSGYDDAPRDAHALSPYIPLEGGVAHYVSVWVFAPGYGMLKEEFRVWAVNPVDDSRTLLIDCSGSNAQKISDWTRFEGTFTPDLGGPYQFEIEHCTQESNVNLVAFDRFFVGRSPDTFSPETPELVTPPADGRWCDVIYQCATKFVYRYEVRTSLVYGSNDSIFVKGLCPSMSRAWVWGKRTGNRVAFPKGQYIGVYQGNSRQFDLFFQPATDYHFNESGVLVFTPADSLTGTIGDDGSLTVDYGQITVESANAAGSLDMAENQCITPFDRSYCYPPSHAKRRELQYQSLINARFPTYRIVEVAEDGDDIYACGFCEDTKMTWIKGYRNGNDVIFPSGQYMGMVGDFPITFTGVSITSEEGLMETPEFVMESAADGGLYTDQVYATQIYDSYGSSYLYFETLLKPYVLEAVRPEKPEEVFHEVSTGTPYVILRFSPLNVDGYLMDLDCLYYRIYLDGRLYRFTTSDYPLLPESTTEISVTYNDSWNFFDYDGYYSRLFSFDELDYDVMEVEMVYRLQGKELTSERYAFPNPTKEPDGIAGVDAGASQTLCYDLQGRRIPASAPGLVIRRTILPDGTVRTEKVLQR